MMDLNGQKLKKSDLQDVFDAIQYDFVLVETDIIGFGHFVDFYSGWLSAPAYSVEKIHMSGVHPSGVGLQVVGSKSWTGMKIYENFDTPSLIEEITNYT